MLQTLNDRYHVRAQIGTGGMAEVYRAEDELLGRSVAIKVLREQYANDKAFLDLFMQEARAAARLSHPNIVGLYDVGKHGDLYYIVMEYVEGSSLKDILEREGRVTVARTLTLGLQICAGLEYAHSKGIIHRDIKPQNILVTPEGVAKIADFGIARALDQATLSEPGQVFGSVYYVSPEQARGQPVTAASDVYSLGVVLYEMLTGELPFQGDTVVAVAMKHLQDDPPSLRERNPRVPAMLEQIVLRALAKTVEDRWSSAGQLGKALRQYAQLGEERTTIFNAMPEAPVRHNAAAAVASPATPPARAEALSMTKQRKGLPTTRREQAPAKKGGVDWLLLILSLITLACLVGLVFLGVEVYRAYSGEVFPLRLPQFPSLTSSPLAGLLPTSVPSPTEKPRLPVPKVEGQPSDVAKDMIEGSGFRYEEAGREYSDTVPADRVIRQTPLPSETLSEGEVVAVVVSKGKATVPVPRVLQMRRADAEDDLKKAGFVVDVQQLWNANVPVDVVYDQKPQPGTPWKQGETVTIYVSKGQETVVVPNVVGMPEAKAREAITNARLRVGSVNYQGKNDLPHDVLTRVNVGSILSTTPQAGTEVPVGAEIAIAVRKE